MFEFFLFSRKLSPKCEIFYVESSEMEPHDRGQFILFLTSFTPCHLAFPVTGEISLFPTCGSYGYMPQLMAFDFIGSVIDF